MKIHTILIKNFRGIKQCEIQFPQNSQVIFLLGAGDTTKSTILEAIQWLLWPTWHLTSVDTDFYKKLTDQNIEILGTFSDIPEELMSEEKFGMYLRCGDTPIDGRSNDEPVDGKPVCITIKLTISGSLEPQWTVICNRKEPIDIMQNDRKKLACVSIGEDSGKDLMWGRNSVLQKYSDSKGILHEVYIQAIRDATKYANLSALDDMTPQILNVGRNFGVEFSERITNKLMYQSGSYTTGVGLFEGDVPLSQMGTGSKRLLSMGLNAGMVTNGSVLLIDEIETGIEPYRLRSLINTLRKEDTLAGQVIATTHSPVTVSEAKLHELLFITHKDGITQAVQMQGDDEEEHYIQGQIRTNAESFLTKRLIVCEGKTELGLIRALDTYMQETEGWKMAYYGVSTFLGGGENTIRNAELLMECGYEVCVLMDSDKEDEEGKKTQLRNCGVHVFDWDKGLTIEQQIFSEATNDVVEKLLSIAIAEKGIESVKSRLEGCSGIIFDDDSQLLLMQDTITIQQKAEIGEIAAEKKQAWYKRIDLGESVGTIVFENYSSFPEEGRIHTVINQLLSWVKKND